jgi:hypothetical protein
MKKRIGNNRCSPRPCACRTGRGWGSRGRGTPSPYGGNGVFCARSSLSTVDSQIWRACRAVNRTCAVSDSLSSFSSRVLCLRRDGGKKFPAFRSGIAGQRVPPCRYTCWRGGIGSVSLRALRSAVRSCLVVAFGAWSSWVYNNNNDNNNNCANNCANNCSNNVSSWGGSARWILKGLADLESRVC